jgi:uncharacterized protein (DUF488 family)
VPPPPEPRPAGGSTAPEIASAPHETGRAAPPGELEVYTFGHGPLPFAELEQRLTEQGIRTLIDVRAVPYSRHNPDVVKRRLEELCAVAGLGYVWMGDRVGGSPDGDDTGSTRAGFAAGIDAIASLASGATVAVMCSELDPERCHRTTMIAPALEVRGFTVVHLLPNGRPRRHQQGLFPTAPPRVARAP